MSSTHVGCTATPLVQVLHSHSRYQFFLWAAYTQRSLTSDTSIPSGSLFKVTILNLGTVETKLIPNSIEGIQCLPLYEGKKIGYCKPWISEVWFISFTVILDYRLSCNLILLMATSSRLSSCSEWRKRKNGEIRLLQNGMKGCPVMHF